MVATPEKHPILKDFLAHVTTVTQVALLGLAIYVVWLCTRKDIGIGSIPLTFHVIFCAVGWTFFMNVSVLCKSECNIFTKYIDQAKKTKVHMAFQIIGFGLSLAAFVILVIDTEDLAHFASAHSVIGLVAVIFGLVTYTNSYLVYYPAKLEKYISPNQRKIFHVCFGIITIILGAVATITGFYTPWFKLQINLNYRAIEWCLAITVLTSVWVLVSPLLNASNRIKSIIS